MELLFWSHFSGNHFYGSHKNLLVATCPYIFLGNFFGGNLSAAIRSERRLLMVAKEAAVRATRKEAARKVTDRRGKLNVVVFLVQKSIF